MHSFVSFIDMYLSFLKFDWLNLPQVLLENLAMHGTENPYLLPEFFNWRRGICRDKSSWIILPQIQTVVFKKAQRENNQHLHITFVMLDTTYSGAGGDPRCVPTKKLVVMWTLILFG